MSTHGIFFFLRNIIPKLSQSTPPELVLWFIQYSRLFESKPIFWKTLICELLNLRGNGILLEVSPLYWMNLHNNEQTFNPSDQKSSTDIQSTLVISNSLILNNCLSRSENLAPVLTKRATKRQQNVVEKRRNCSLGAISPLFHNIFNISLNLGVKLHIHSV